MTKCEIEKTAAADVISGAAWEPADDRTMKGFLGVETGVPNTLVHNAFFVQTYLTAVVSSNLEDSLESESTPAMTRHPTSSRHKVVPLEPKKSRCPGATAFCFGELGTPAGVHLNNRLRNA